MAGLTNTGALKGKTLFITGASRGIGLAIAVKAARDGANVVVAAKTAQKHSKLEGTIFSAAEAIEQAGGHALPLAVDIRSEEAVQGAVDSAVKHFGGIDVLVNNASAISLTGTLETPMKKYDLMNQVNARGTYLASRTCLPHLLKGKNPHILNLSPPLNMHPGWFKGHVAYTMAKYGMSMCALGMAEEFRGRVAVNALWPRTAIYTAAMEMLGGGKEVAGQCRKVDIMADAAYHMLTQPIEYTGNFAIDDEVLASAGVTDMEQYAMVRGQALLPDFFLGEPQQAGGIGQQPSSSSSGFASQFFESLRPRLSASLVSDVKAVYVFDLQEDGQWHLDLKNGSGAIGRGAVPCDVTLSMTSAQLQDIVTGKASPAAMVMGGQIQMKGSMMKAMGLERLLKAA